MGGKNYGSNGGTGGTAKEEEEETAKAEQEERQALDRPPRSRTQPRGCPENEWGTLD